MALLLRDKIRYDIRLMSADPLVREVFGDEIAEAGHLVVAVAGIPATPPDDDVDLVLIDESSLADLDTTLLARIGEAWPHAAVALFCEGPVAARAHGLPCIPKDARTPDLIAAVEAAARGAQIDLGPQARTSRMDLFVRRITSHPAMAGIGRVLPSVYQDSVAQAVPSAMSRLLGRLPPAE